MLFHTLNQWIKLTLEWPMSACDHTKWQERKLENEFDINVKVMSERNIRMWVFFMRCLTHICVSFVVFFYFISPNGHFDDDIEFLKSGYRTRFYAQSIETQVQSKHFVTIEMSTIMIASISLLWFGCDEHFCLFSLEIIGLYRFSIQIQI